MDRFYILEQRNQVVRLIEGPMVKVFLNFPPLRYKCIRPPRCFASERNGTLNNFSLHSVFNNAVADRCFFVVDSTTESLFSKM